MFDLKVIIDVFILNCLESDLDKAKREQSKVAEEDKCMKDADEVKERLEKVCKH